MSSVLVAIALLACMVVLVIRYRKKEEELEVKEERLTEVILENRDLKAANDSEDGGYYQFDNMSQDSAENEESPTAGETSDQADGQTDEKWFSNNTTTSEEADGAIRIKRSSSQRSQSPTRVVVVETSDDYTVIYK